MPNVSFTEKNSRHLTATNFSCPQNQLLHPRSCPPCCVGVVEDSLEGVEVPDHDGVYGEGVHVHDAVLVVFPVEVPHAGGGVGQHRLAEQLVGVADDGQAGARRGQVPVLGGGPLEVEVPSNNTGEH